MKKNKKSKLDQPLTLNTFLDALADYNQKVLFAALEERFVSKKEFNSKLGDFENKLGDLDNRLKSFEDQTLTRLDKILKELDTLKTEKEVRKYQREKDKQLWLIVIKALKEHDILKSKDLKLISELGIF